MRVLSSPSVRETWLPAGLILAALAVFAAFAFQTVALLSTSASNTGFLTGLNVVFVPIIASLVLRQPIPFNVKLAVTFAVTLATVLVCGSLGSTLALWREKTFQALAMTVLVLVLWFGLWELVAAGALAGAYAPGLGTPPDPPAPAPGSVAKAARRSPGKTITRDITLSFAPDTTSRSTVRL